jgi:hypothetical protein
VLQFRGHFKLRQAGPDEPQNLLKQLAAHQRRLNHQGQLVLVLHPAQRLHQRRGQLGKKAAPQPRRQSGPPAGQFGHGSPGRVETGKLHAGLRGQPLDGGNRRGT